MCRNVIFDTRCLIFAVVIFLQCEYVPMRAAVKLMFQTVNAKLRCNYDRSGITCDFEVFSTIQNGNIAMEAEQHYF